MHIRLSSFGNVTTVTIVTYPSYSYGRRVVAYLLRWSPESVAIVLSDWFRLEGLSAATADEDSTAGTMLRCLRTLLFTDSDILWSVDDEGHLNFERRCWSKAGSGLHGWHCQTMAQQVQSLLWSTVMYPVSVVCVIIIVTKLTDSNKCR